jgi:hypothetical protein
MAVYERDGLGLDRDTAFPLDFELVEELRIRIGWDGACQLQ